MPRSRSAVAAIARLLDASPQPVYALDEARELVYLNAACGPWLNLDVERLIGQRCDYHSRPPSSPLEAVTCALCPPPDLCAGSPGLTRIVVPVEGGVESRRSALVTPLLRRGGAAGALVVVAAEESADDGTTPSDARRLHARLREIRHESRARFHWDRLVGVSTWAQRARDLARLSADGGANTVVFGPPGTGREHLARTIHAARCAAAGRDVRLATIDCSVADEGQLERALAAAVVAGPASASAVGPRGPAGDGGTSLLLLLNVDRLSAEGQAIVHRRLSAARQTLGQASWQTLSTASRSLWRASGEGAGFRADLAVLLATIEIEMAPLSERREDVPLLAQLFVEEENAAGRRQFAGFTGDALERLLNYSWPGNVDQLASLVRECRERCEGPLITTVDLPEVIDHATSAASHPRREEETIALDEFLVEVERELLERALTRARGNKAGAARLLGISRARLHRRLDQLGITSTADSESLGETNAKIDLESPDAADELKSAGAAESSSGDAADFEESPFRALNDAHESRRKGDQD